MSLNVAYFLKPTNTVLSWNYSLQEIRKGTPGNPGLFELKQKELKDFS